MKLSPSEQYAYDLVTMFGPARLRQLAIASLSKTGISPQKEAIRKECRRLSGHMARCKDKNAVFLNGDRWEKVQEGEFAPKQKKRRRCDDPALYAPDFVPYPDAMSEHQQWVKQVRAQKSMVIVARARA